MSFSAAGQITLSFLKRFFWDILAILLLSLFVGIILHQNYTPGTWLSGWDNLHPEFNFGLNIERSLSAAWQEYQGLGLLGGMSHAADLSRQVFLWLLSFLLPISTLRYAGTFFALWIGTLGAYFLTRFLLSFQKHKNLHVTIQLASFVAAFFYLFNLATVQNFFVPYESFSYFYCFFPWLLFALLRYLKEPKLKTAMLFFLISFLATSAFYVQTLFVVYSTFVGTFFLEDLIRKKFRSILSIFLAGFIILAANSFWLLPSLYFTVTNAQVTVQAKINQLSTPEAQLMNEAAGTLQNSTTLKGYWLDYVDYTQDHGYIYLLAPWRDYVSLYSIQTIEIGLFFISLGGILLHLGVEKKKASFSLPIFFLFILIMLSAGNGLIGQLFNILSNHVPLFGQMFRTAFTKWSVAGSLIYAIGIGFFFFYFTLLFSRTNKILLVFFQFLLFIGICSGILISIWPIFTGNFIYKQMEVRFPPEYFDLFNYFETQPKQARIASLPAYQFWSWNFYNWNYRGSGFLWYGIEQPILDRAFDVWSNYNEQFYDEFATALYSDNSEQLIQVIKKYDISYFLLDKSIIVPADKSKTGDFQEIETKLRQLGINPSFSEGSLEVFNLNTITQDQSFVTSPSSVSNIHTDNVNIKTRKDIIFSQEGNYISNMNSPSKDYPFADLLQEKVAQGSPNIQIHEDTIQITRPLLQNNADDTLFIPELEKDKQYTVNTKVTYKDGEISLEFPQITLTTDQQQVILPHLLKAQVKTRQKLKKVIIDFGESYVILGEGDSQNIVLHFSVGEPNLLKVSDAQKINVQNGNLFISDNNVEKLTIDSSIWDLLDTPFHLDLSQNTKEISVLLPRSPIKVDLSQLNSQNCDVFKRGDFHITQTSLSVEYISNNDASVCGNMELPAISNHQAYLLYIRGENQHGRSLKFYLQNNENLHADIEDLLPDHTFETFYSVLPWDNLKQKDYSLNIENRSFGEKSQNTLKEVTFYPIDLQQLANISLLPSQLPTSFINSLAISNLEKKGTFLYTLHTSSSFNSPSLNVFQLSQSYSSGWVAFPRPSSWKEVAQIPQNLFKHVKYNGWANAWEVPQGEYEVVILYWPQLLSFFGYGLLVVTFVCFGVFALFREIWKASRKRNKQKTAPQKAFNFPSKKELGVE